MQKFSGRKMLRCCFWLEKSKVEIFKKTGTEIGKKAAERSGGLFSADDWHCSR